MKSPALARSSARLVKIDLLADHAPSDEMTARITRARALAPGRIDYVLTHAELLASAGDFKGARNVVGPLLTSAYPETVRESARRLMSGLVVLEKAGAQ